MAGVIGSMPFVPALGRWRARDRPSGGARLGLDLAPTAALMLIFVASMHADGRTHLQPVHLFPILMRRFTNLVLVAGISRSIIALPLAANLRGIDGADAEAENRTLARIPGSRPTWTSSAAFGRASTPGSRITSASARRWCEWYGVDALLLARRFPVPDGRSSAGRLAVLCRRWRARRLHATSMPLPPGRGRELADTVVTRARLVPSARHRLRVHDPARTRARSIRNISPDRARVDTGCRAADQVITATTDTGVVVDVRRALIAANRKERLFHRTDTHWNERGAFLAYQQIIDAVHVRLPAVPPPRDRVDFDDAPTRILRAWIWPQ